MLRANFVTIGAAAIALGTCNTGSASPSDTPVKASGTNGQRTFAIADFDSVSLAGPDNVEVRVGPAFSVTASGDTGVMQALEIKKDGATLEIGRKNKRNGFHWGDDDGDGKYVKIVVTMPAIRGASLAGSGDLSVDKVQGGSFNASLAGSGDLSVAQMAVTEGEVSLAGSGDMRLAGTADRIKVSIAGSGDVDGGGLTAKGGSVSVAGSGNVRMNVDGQADVSLVGSGDVDLGAKARCTTSKIGSGEARCGG